MKRPEGAEGYRNPANELQHLRTGKYHARELFLILKENAQIPMADKISQDEMRFVRRHKTHNHQPITEFPDKNLEDWLKYWLKIFDRAYFFNAVQRAYKGFHLVSEQNDEEFIARQKQGGDISVGWWNSQTRKIYLVFQDYAATGQEPISIILGTLLHEMLHAFLELYLCNGFHCAEFIVSQEGLGELGHGVVWANSICKLHEVSIRDLGIVLDCSIDCGLEQEIRHGCMYRDDQLKRWGHEELIPVKQAVSQERIQKYGTHGKRFWWLRLPFRYNYIWGAH